MNRPSFKAIPLFPLLISLIFGLSLSCKSSTTETEGDTDVEVALEQEDDQAGDGESVDQGDLLERGDTEPQVEEDPTETDVDFDRIDEDPVDESDRPTDQVEDPEADVADPPAEDDLTDLPSEGDTETEQTDPTSLWMIFEGFVSGGGHAASSQYKLHYGRLGGSSASGAAQSTHYRISHGGISGR